MADDRKTMKVSEETGQMLFNTWMTFAQVEGKRPTYDKVIQKALYALAETPDFKRAFLPELLETTRKDYDENGRKIAKNESAKS